MCALSLASRYALEVGKNHRVNRLNRTAGFVAIFYAAFVLPLGLASDATRKTKPLALGVKRLEAAETN